MIAATRRFKPLAPVARTPSAAGIASITELTPLGPLGQVRRAVLNVLKIPFRVFSSNWEKRALIKFYRSLFAQGVYGRALMYVFSPFVQSPPISNSKCPPT